MKALLIIAIATLSFNSLACDITLKAKSETAKNAKLDGVSFSAKQLSALKTICNVTIKEMNDEELVEDFKASLARKKAKKDSASN